MSTNKSFDKPLASFDTEKDACNYVYDIAKTKNGSTVLVEGRRVR
jgi:L-lactate utilization protein LutB